MHQAQRIVIHRYGVGDPLSSLEQSVQLRYLRCYFTDLAATTVLEEPNYFDRDYLAEFSAFYSTSAKGYPNLCRRLHFFSGQPLTRGKIRNAADGGRRALNHLQENYLGFVVLRPIPAAHLGRTVVRWYPDPHESTTPRVVAPSRNYQVHFAGLTLTVTGLAWQQQDSAVGACATVGLWTMLHSSAFDDHHAIPTTADITQAAHKRASLGARIFPSAGLNIFQICEAIKEQNLSPLPVEGDVHDESGDTLGFKRERFSSSCAALLRSGYPVLIIGELDMGEPDRRSMHAMCAVGFRSAQPQQVEPWTVSLEDSAIKHLYIHDDNLGPSVRFIINEEDVEIAPAKITDDPGSADQKTVPAKTTKRVVLKPDSPRPRLPQPPQDCPTVSYPGFRPRQLLVAVHNGLRTSPDTLHLAGLRMGNLLQQAQVLPTSAPLGITFSARFVKLSSYIGDIMRQTLPHRKGLLGRVRLDLCERVPPMSLHVGLIRIGLHGGPPLVDILYDTSDSDRNHPVFAHVVYNDYIGGVIGSLQNAGKAELFGVYIKAY